MASITVSGTITIDIEGLELNLEKLTTLREQINNKIQELIQKISKVADADNWPHIQEGSERLKKIYETAKARIEENIERIKTEINNVLEKVRQAENEVQQKFGQLLIDYGNKLMEAAEDEPITIDTSALENAPINGPESTSPEASTTQTTLKNKISTVTEYFKTQTDAVKQKVTSSNAFGTIKSLFNISSGSSILSQIAEKGRQTGAKIKSFLGQVLGR